MKWLTTIIVKDHIDREFKFTSIENTESPEQAFANGMKEVDSVFTFVSAEITRVFEV